jgi:hypothetical protein
MMYPTFVKRTNDALIFLIHFLLLYLYGIYLQHNTRLKIHPATKNGAYREKNQKEVKKTTFHVLYI